MIDRRSKGIRSLVVLVVAVLLGVVSTAGVLAAETITVWISSSPGEAMANATNLAIQRFETDYPEWKVKYQTVATDWPEFIRKLAAGFLAGRGPHMFEADEATAAAFIGGGYIKPVADKYVKELLSAGMYKNILSLATLSGQVVGVPYNYQMQAMYYNKQMFAEAGLTHPPKTWDELVTFGKKLTKFDAEGKPTQIGFSVRFAGNPIGIVDKFSPFVWQLGGEYFVEENGIPVKSAMGDSAWKKALQFYVDLVYKHRISSLEFPNPTPAFLTGKSAMHYRGTWEVTYIREDAPDINFGTAVPPIPEGGKQAVVAYVQVYCLSTQNSPAEEEACMGFLKTRLIPEIQVSYIKAASLFPLTEAVANDPYFKDPVFDAFKQLVPYGKPLMYNTARINELYNVMGAAIQEGLYKKLPVEEALAKSEAEVNKILAEERTSE